MTLAQAWSQWPIGQAEERGASNFLPGVRHLPPIDCHYGGIAACPESDTIAAWFNVRSKNQTSAAPMCDTQARRVINRTSAPSQFSCAFQLQARRRVGSATASNRQRSDR